MANMAMSAPQATPLAEEARDPDRRPAARLATAVPWENSSPVSSVAPSRNSSVTILPANCGWSLSMPVSMNPMVTPAPGLDSLPLQQFDVGVRPVGIDHSRPHCLAKLRSLVRYAWASSDASV